VVLLFVNRFVANTDPTDTATRRENVKKIRRKALISSCDSLRAVCQSFVQLTVTKWTWSDSALPGLSLPGRECGTRDAEKKNKIPPALLALCTISVRLS